MKLFAKLVIALLFTLLTAMPAHADDKNSPDKKTPIAELETKCTAGNLEYCVQIAANYQDGNLVAKDKAKAFKMYGAYCEQNNMRACMKLGVAYYSGIGTDEDKAKAALYTGKACYGNNPIACRNLGVFYTNGTIATGNYTKANEYFRKSCTLEAGKGCISLATAIAEGQGTANDDENITSLFERGCVDAKSCRWAGQYYKKAKNNDRAAYFYKKACVEFESGTDCAALAYVYEADDKYRQGMESHDKACDLGYQHSCAVIGYYYKKGWGVEINFDRAAKILGAACEADKPSYWACNHAGDLFESVDRIYATFKLGKFEEQHGYKANINTDVDIKKSDGIKAAYYYNIACNGGRKGSCTSLGYLYKNGLYGLAENQIKATKAYLKGCDIKSKNTVNCHYTAQRLMEGKGTSKDPEKAISLFEKICNKNKYSDACYELGLIYQLGEHLPKNMAKAEQIYFDGCKFDQPRRTTGSCFALAKVYSEKNKFMKADAIYHTVCEDDGRSTNCEPAILFKHNHLCRLGKEKSCDLDYVVSLYEDTQKKTKKSIALKPSHTPKPDYTPTAPKPTQKNLEEKPKKMAGLCGGLSPDQCLDLGFDYNVGKNGRAKDLAKARDIFVHACDLNHARACKFAGSSYRASAGTSYNSEALMKQARKYYLKACDLGMADGCYYAADTYPAPKYDETLYDKEKLPFLERACKMGSKGGCNGVALINKTGDYAPR